MIFHYVDAENVNLNSLDQKHLSVLDRVFVFTKHSKPSANYSNHLYEFIGGYPTGKDQADFYIIAHLSRVLGDLTQAEKKVVSFHIHSKDKNLCTAFEFQCSLAGAVFSKPLYEEGKKPNLSVVPKQKDKPEESEVIAIASRLKSIVNQPVSVTEIRASLPALSQQDFTRSFNWLIQNKEIKRSKNTPKKWVSVSSL